ncbi:transmembrane domain-containing protein [Patescibacteria group bacterium]|nr:transmembrane domain-containing protein [Patescibacteria group bacterium]
MRYILLAVVFLVSASMVEAATLYMDPNTVSLNRGDAAKISIRLDTDEAAGECINAIDAVISYSDNIIPVDISVGKSILPIWVENPVINKENNTISFAGGIPNGYCGRVQGDPNLTNTLVEIFFRAPGMQVGGGEARSQATVQFTDETTAYLNDGAGTPASLQKIGANFTLGDNVGSEILDPWSGDVQSDDAPPEEFSASVEMIDNKWFVVFNTTDKQTGISHYEVIEETYSQSKLFDFGAATAPGVETRSPHLLKDQSRNSVVRVRAIDKAGNEYVATVPVDESARRFSITPELMVMAGIAITGVLILLGLVYWFIRRRRAKKNTLANLEESDSGVLE